MRKVKEAQCARTGLKASNLESFHILRRTKFCMLPVIVKVAERGEAFERASSETMSTTLARICIMVIPYAR
jgi:hypothetical protein